jgi:two-component system phosphate regulon sensor histidine kinase PhoR
MKAEEKDIRFDLMCDETISAPLNPALLELAFGNLVDNAIKYSHSGSNIRVEASQTDGNVIVTIQDHGIGIPKDHLPRLFERFYRVDKARSRKLGGTGLGLALVKHIVQAHRGQVSVESSPGKGSMFTIHLPRSSSPQNPA